MGEVEATFSVSRVELVEAFRAMQLRRREIRAIYLFLVLCVVLAVGSEGMRRSGPRYGVLALELAFFSAMALFTRFYPRLQANQVKQTPEETWQFGPAGARVRTSLSSADISWAAITRVVEGRTCFHLFLSDAEVHPVPKRALSAEQQLALRNGFREWLAERAQLCD